MNIDHYKETVMEAIIDPMISFMEDWDDCDYTAEDVEACKELMDDYLDSLDELPDVTDEAIMELVKNLVLALNELNEQTDYSLIETDAREEICDVIQNSAVECGLLEYGADITEEWREW